MTLFGWIYLVILIIGSINVIMEIGKPRKPRTPADAAGYLIATGLVFWALYAWGIRG